VKSDIEAGWFTRHRDLFTDTDLLYFDTTSTYVEGTHPEELAAFGYSRDHRGDRRQVGLGVVMPRQGLPVAHVVFPGNTADPSAFRLALQTEQQTLGVTRVMLCCDRGMVTEKNLQALRDAGMTYLVATRLRRNRVVQQVLSHPGRYQTVADNLEVKEVDLPNAEDRYIVCHNPEQAKKDAADRQAILEALAKKLKQGTKALVGNRGFRRYLFAEKGAIWINSNKVELEARYDGKWVLRTNTDLSVAEIAQRYKQLLTVEQFFRAAKSLLETRPIFHKVDTTITGHIFCSFLALLLMHELKERLRKRGDQLEWADILRDLEALEKVEVRHNGKSYLLRTPLQGVCGKVFQAVGACTPRTEPVISRESA